MNGRSRVPVAVLGAGLTGLAAAERLRSWGIRCRVFEKSDEVGGLVRTQEEAGFRFDRTGHLLHLRSDALRAEVLDWLDGECLTVSRRSLVWSHGVYTRYPFQANTFGLPAQVAYDCLHGFVEAFFSDDQRQPSNFEEFCLARFGAGISRHFMLPYNRRLWGVSLREITTAWCQRFVPLPRLEDVLAGAVGLNDRELGYNTEFLYPRKGIGALATALGKRAGEVELSKPPRHILNKSRELVFDAERVGYEALVSTIPLPLLLDLFDELPPEVARVKGLLRSTRLYYLDVALRVPAGQDFHWVYVPEERYPFYRVGCYSRFSPDMAPDGSAGLYVELADRGVPNLDTLIPDVLRGLREMGIIDSAADVLFTRLREIEHAYVIYDHQRQGALDVILPFLESSGVFSTGRYGGWNYSSMEDAIEFGRNAAVSARARLT